MSRRCPAPMIAMAAALAFGLGSQPMSSRADSLTTIPTFTTYDPSSMSSSDISQWKPDTSVQIKYDGIDGTDPSNPANVLLKYTLTTSRAIAPAGANPPADATTNPPVPQVLGLDTPISIVPPAGSATNPLQVLKDTSGYYTKNPDELLVGIGTTSLQQNGQPVQVQALALSFYGAAQGQPPAGLAAGDSVMFELPFSKSALGYSTDSSTSGSGSNTPPASPQGGQSTGGEVPEPFSLLVWSALAGAAIRRARSRRVGPRA